jgi:hypothetical protein
VRATGDSVGHVRAWINVHPDMFNEDTWLFCRIGGQVKERMDYGHIYGMIDNVKRRAIKAGFPPNRRINPHNLIVSEN